MQIGILNTDTIKPEFATKYGQYPAMFSRILLQADPSIQIKDYEIQRGEYPKDINECDAYLITGSKVSAYDDLPWVQELKKFIISLDQRKKKLVGICFGHQLIAQALGGLVTKSKRGWHVGIDSVQLNNDASKFGKASQEFKLIYNHQDEVQKMPANAKLLAGSKNCPIAMMSIDDHILTFQGHIEFKKEYSQDLLEMRKNILGDLKYEQACRSLENETNELQVTHWILDFIS